MNQYSVWKYLLILFVVAIGVIYALPNLYGEDPALQITSSRGFELPIEVPATIDSALVAEQIDSLSSEQQGNRLLYRFNNTEDQIRAADILRAELGDSYIVALNLAHATPEALRAIGGKPMTLGLDLQGGVHFLMQVDMDTARSQQLDRFVDDIRAVLRDEGIRYISVRHEGNGLLMML
ncbi:MAG: protein translocase subunit SecD, partial [Xanthomonadales bacterium]|nr:protein translocase subunit SecD [Xanthomonadales bacterium]